MEFYVTPVDSDLYHHGVKGMRWGVRKKIDESRINRARKYTNLSVSNAVAANRSARNNRNGSRYLERSEKYSKKATKITSKIQDEKTKKSFQKDLKLTNELQQTVAKDYVQRSKKERVATFATSAAVSAGAVYLASAAGLPYAMVWITSGTKYNLKEQKE